MNQTDPEFYFDKNGRLWFAHMCDGMDGSFLREYSLPPSIYEVSQRDPITVEQVIACGRCKVRGRLIDGEWVKHKTPTS